MPEPRPAELFVGPAAALANPVEPIGKRRLHDRLIHPHRPVLSECVQVVQAPEEEQIRDLLDDFDGTGNAARPEGRSRSDRSDS